VQRLLLAGQVLDKSIQNPQAGRRNVLAYKENSRIDSENLGHFDDLAQRRIDLSSLQGINVMMEILEQLKMDNKTYFDLLNSIQN